MKCLEKQKVDFSTTSINRGPSISSFQTELQYEGLSVDEKTDVLFVPYFDSQLQYLSFEFTVTKPDGTTEIVNLNASTIVDSPEFSTSKREELQKFVDITEITEPIHVFKVYGGTSKGTKKHIISVKVNPTGTYSYTEKLISHSES